jgi:hypothetical protein
VLVFFFTLLYIQRSAGLVWTVQRCYTRPGARSKKCVDVMLCTTWQLVGVNTKARLGKEDSLCSGQLD